MKKVILFALMAVACCITAMAGDGTKVVEGSFKSMKDKVANVYFKPIDFKGATWDNKGDLSTHYMNLNDLAKTGLRAMEAEFNSECKKMQTSTEAEANYVVSIKVTNMDSYYNVMGWGLPGHITKIWGDITITDKATGNVVVVLNMKETDGGRNHNTDQSFVDAWDAVGKILATRINKGK